MTLTSLSSVVDFLLDCAGAQAFKPWEVQDESPRMRMELDKLDPLVRVAEMLHKAAFRTGLGYSIYSPDHMVRNFLFICSPPALWLTFLSILP